MRIASKANVSLIVGVLALTAGIASAMEPPMPSGPAPMPPETEVASATTPSLSSLPIADAKAPGEAPAPAVKTSLPGLEAKVPDSVKDVIKHLDKTSEDLTLDDLNSARQAVAKIEALIEIEKRISELEKVRQERQKKSSLANAIPASALQPPGGMRTPPSMTPQGMESMPVMSSGTQEIRRIFGRNGHYTAVIRTPDGRSRNMQVGDHTPDGGTVVSITTTEVEIAHGNSRQTLHIKNVESVFSNNSY